MFNLKKVDFIWINRDQKSFEWFVNLLSQLEAEQQEHGGELGRFLEMHMYVTSALQRTDMKAVALQLALDLMHEKEKKDLVTGLKARTNAGRPNWTKVLTKVLETKKTHSYHMSMFQMPILQIREERKGEVTVFYCGNPGAYVFVSVQLYFYKHENILLRIFGAYFQTKKKKLNVLRIITFTLTIQVLLGL